MQTNCPNCGAPITGPKCEYCGTVFTDENQLDVLRDKIHKVAAEKAQFEQNRFLFGLLSAAHRPCFDCKK